MATRMQQRRATAEQWLLADPILAAGELGYETDTASFKIGDGINNWSLLDYFETNASLQGTLDDYIPLTQKGAALGVAELDANGFVPAEQLDVDLTGYATETYVDTAETDAVTAANAYTDTRETAITTAYQTYADTAETNAESYSDSLIGDVTVDGTAGNTVTDRISTAIAGIVDTAPEALDTLNELAAALGDDPNFATTIATQIGGKADASHTHAISDVTDLQTTLDAKAPLTPSVNAKTGAYTLTAADKGEVITANGTFTITVPGNVFAAGDRVDFINTGTGVITFAGSSLTLNSKDSAVTIDSQYAGATILFGSATVAYLIGAIA